MAEIIEKELSYLVMQAAFEVHNTLGPGFPEVIYEEAMVRELAARNVPLQGKAIGRIHSGFDRQRQDHS